MASICHVRWIPFLPSSLCSRTSSVGKEIARNIIMALRSVRVAIIGAGAAGLAAARELRGEGHVPVVFEQAAGVGGTWIYDDDDADEEEEEEEEEEGHHHHSSMYASLRTNLPREVMGFLDFPFYSSAIINGDPRRFPCHEEVLRYIQEFARRFDLYGLIRFRTKVLLLNHLNKHKQQWIVRCRNEEEEEEYEEEFDAVVVCNGHYTEPRLAHIPGVDSWPGKQMHSHRYRVPDPFLNQVVVIIGAKNSGGDISRDIAGVAKEVHMADRAAPAARKLLPGYHNLWLRSMVERADQDGTVVFRNGGGSVKADVIMHCTGYKYRFPFLLPGNDKDDSAVVTVDDNRVHPLYKHVFPPRLAPTLSFIGLPFKVIPFPLFQLQSNWVAGVLSGRIQLPSQHQMMQDVTDLYSELEAMGWPKRHTHCLKYNQFEYDDWLADQCGYSKVEDWRKHMYDAVSEKKKLCPETYRDEWNDHHLLQQANQDFQKYL